MSKTTWIIITVIIVVMLGYLVYAQNAAAPEDTTPTTSTDGSQDTTPTVTPTPLPPVDSDDTNVSPTPSNEPAQPIKEITLEASEFKYNQMSLTLAPGQKVRLTLKNGGNMPHDFDIDGVTDGSLVQPGQQTVQEFAAPAKAGSYAFYCSVGSHRSLGMEGTLVVQ